MRPLWVPVLPRWPWNYTTIRGGAAAAWSASTPRRRRLRPGLKELEGTGRNWSR